MAEDPKQQVVKAAFVFNIAKFVSWPATNQSTNQLRICSYNTSPLGTGGELLKRRKFHGKPVVLATLEQWEGINRCTILLVSADNLTRFESDRLTAEPKSTLVIADFTQHDDLAGVAYEGVHVSLVRKGTRIGFEINLTGLEESGLKVSSELLKLADIVERPR
ncbi:YfiR family protein [Halioxenophilus aromaticivorans]